jgi:hypothetical protein
MGRVDGPGLQFSVSYSADGFDLFKSFKGERVFSDASQSFDAVKARADVLFADLCRLDGDRWVYVAPVFRREGAGGGGPRTVKPARPMQP